MTLGKLLFLYGHHQCFPPSLGGTHQPPRGPPRGPCLGQLIGLTELHLQPLRHRDDPIRHEGGLALHARHALGAAPGAWHGGKAPKNSAMWLQCHCQTYFNIVQLNIVQVNIVQLCVLTFWQWLLEGRRERLAKLLHFVPARCCGRWRYNGAHGNFCTAPWLCQSSSHAHVRYQSRPPQTWSHLSCDHNQHPGQLVSTKRGLMPFDASSLLGHLSAILDFTWFHHLISPVFAKTPKHHTMELHIFSIWSTKSSLGGLCTRWYCTP